MGLTCSFSNNGHLALSSMEPQAGPVMRLHIGLEDPADLLADIERGLAAANAVN